MRSIVFFSPHDLPHAHISRNFDFAKRLVQNGNVVTIIANNFSHRDKSPIIECSKNYYVIDNIDGVEVVWLNTIWYRKNDIKRALNAISYMILAIYFSIFKIRKIDFCIGDSVPPTAGLSAYIVSTFKVSKFIYQVRDVWPIALVYDGAIKRNSITYLLLRCLEKFLYKKSHKIYSTVPFLSSHVMESGASSDKISYVPNGVDLNVIAHTLAKPNINGPFTITYAGGFGNAHDVESIILTARILKSAEFKFRFNFYGEGPKLNSCIALSDSLKLDNIYFFKSVNKSRLSEIMSESDILIAAVTDSEAYKFGVNLNKIYDYLAAGRPIILACKSSHRPVEDSKSGYVVDPERPEQIAERILHICRLNPDQRLCLGNNARKYAEDNYNLDNLAYIFETNLD